LEKCLRAKSQIKKVKIIKTIREMRMPEVYPKTQHETERHLVLGKDPSGIHVCFSQVKYDSQMARGHIPE
jgi:phenylpyruvate tautomerase PptA (4-oxalocrotonate tautomerase family)